MKINLDALRKYRTAWEWFCNIALAMMYAAFTYSFILDFMKQHRLSSLLLIVFELTLVLLLLIRRMPKEVSLSFYDWVIAVMGTCMVVFLRPDANVHDQPFLILLQMIGMAIALSGLFSLNRSYGTVPANRGVQSKGFYRFVRHPIYTGYFIYLSAFVAQNPTPSNIIVLVMILSFKILRIIAEETFLSQDPDYVAYKQKTRWRLLPFVY